MTFKFTVFLSLYLWHYIGIMLYCGVQQPSSCFVVVNHDAAESQVREGLSQATTEHSVDADSGLHYVDMPPEASHSLPTQVNVRLLPEP